MSKVNVLGLLDESVVKKFAEKIYKIADDYDFNPSMNACLKIAQEWNIKKSGLRAILRKHPLWNEERQMIWFDADISRSLEWQSIGDFWTKLRREINKKIADIDREADKIRMFYPDEVYYINMESELSSKANELFKVYMKIGRIRDEFDNIREQFFSEEKHKVFIDRLNEINENYKLRYNEKTSKAINKICVLEGWDTREFCGVYEKHTNDGGGLGNNYDRWYANVCDNLNPNVVTRHTLVSINLIDYLLMSNGTSWNSCHWIGYRGCYCAGTTSYMLDSDSIIMYTVDKAFTGDEIEMQRKISRQVFGYNDELMCQLRLYPQSNDCGAEHSYREMREIMQKVMAECEGKVNRWKTSHNDVEDVVDEDHYYACYPDWHKCNPGGEHAKISYFRDRDESKPKRISFGAMPICVSCGDSYDDTTESICCECCNEDSYECEHCGNRVSEDYVRWVGDYPYCEDCAIYCDRCGDYETEDDAYWIESENRYICHWCFENHYVACADCGEYVDNDDAYYTSNGDYVCRDCCNDNYTLCEECDEYYPNSEIIEHNGHYHCETCFDDNFAECEECGSIYNRNELKEINGKLICEGCADVTEDEESEVA